MLSDHMVGWERKKQTIIYMNHPTTFKGRFGSATMYYEYNVLRVDTVTVKYMYTHVSRKFLIS